MRCYRRAILSQSVSSKNFLDKLDCKFIKSMIKSDSSAYGYGC